MPEPAVPLRRVDQLARQRHPRRAAPGTPGHRAGRGCRRPGTRAGGGMRGLEVPRLNSNDDTCQLVEWICADGARVGAQAVVAVVETSKAAADVCSGAAGILQTTVPVGTECRVGEVIDYVFASERERQDFLRLHERGGAESGGAEGGDAARGPAHHDGSDAGPLVLTEPARRRSESAGLTEAQLRSLGKRIIQRADIEPLLAHTDPNPSRSLSARQQAIA